MIQLNENEKRILTYSKNILSGKEMHSFSKNLGKDLNERSIEVPWVAFIVKKLNIKYILDIGLSLSSLDYLCLLLELKKKNNVIIESVDLIDRNRVINRYPKELLNEILSIPMYIGDIREVPLKKDNYEGITCISTIEHIGFDIATRNNPKTVFERKRTPENVIKKRDPNINKIVLDKLSDTLKNNGYLLISAPIGRGGAIIVQDSLGYYAAEYEYEKNSWNEIIKHPKFKLIEQFFFKFNDEGYWVRIKKIEELSTQDSSLKKHAQGCGLTLLKNSKSS